MASVQALSHWTPNPSTGERGTAIKLNSDLKASVVFANGRTVVIKHLDFPHRSRSSTSHLCRTSVAKFSPSGNYVASGDVSGLVRVWDAVGEDQVLKVQVKAIGGPINDLAWDGDSGGKRLIAVGEGRERLGHAFSVDGGNSVGEIVGHSKPVRAVAIRPVRPFRAVTASDDTTLAFFQGTPYKFHKTIRTHTKFVQTVEYSHDGALFGSGGSDARIFIYDGTSGDLVGQVGSEQSKEKHSGTVNSIAWSPLDPSCIASFASDATVRLWDASNGQQINAWMLAGSSTPETQQVGGTWLEGNRFVSLAYNGDLTIFDVRQSQPVKIVKACQKGVISVSKCPIQSGYHVGDHSGRVMHYSKEGECTSVKSKPASNIIRLSASKTKVFSIGMDDCVREIDPTEVSYSSSNAVPLPEQPRSLQARGNDNVALVITSNQARLIESGNSLATIPLNFDATVCAISKKFGAIGSSDGKLRIYNVQSNTLEEIKVLEGSKSSVLALAISPNEGSLAVGEQSGKILVYDLNDGPSFKLKISTQWCYHSAKILSLDWRSCSSVLASSSLDSHVFIWGLKKPLKNLSIKNAHVGGTTQVLWEDDHTLLSAGADGSIKRYTVDLGKLLL